MKGRSLRFRRPWLLLVGAVALIAAHATILRYVLPHAALSTAVVSGVIILVVIKHLGLLGSLFALFRRQSRH
jgi:hypothetical protein